MSHYLFNWNVWPGLEGLFCSEDGPCKCQGLKCPKSACPHTIHTCYNPGLTRTSFYKFVVGWVRLKANFSFLSKNARYMEVKVGHYLLFMLSPPKNKLNCFRNKKCLFTCGLIVFHLTQPSSKQIIYFDFQKTKIVHYLIIF